MIYNEQMLFRATKVNYTPEKNLMITTEKGGIGRGGHLTIFYIRLVLRSLYLSTTATYRLKLHQFSENHHGNID